MSDNRDKECQRDCLDLLMLMHNNNISGIDFVRKIHTIVQKYGDLIDLASNSLPCDMLFSRNELSRILSYEETIEDILKAESMLFDERVCYRWNLTKKKLIKVLSFKNYFKYLWFRFKTAIKNAL